MRWKVRKILTRWAVDNFGRAPDGSGHIHCQWAIFCTGRGGGLRFEGGTQFFGEVKGGPAFFQWVKAGEHNDTMPWGQIMSPVMSEGIYKGQFNQTSKNKVSLQPTTLNAEIHIIQICPCEKLYLQTVQLLDCWMTDILTHTLTDGTDFIPLSTDAGWKIIKNKLSLRQCRISPWYCLAKVMTSRGVDAGWHVICPDCQQGTSLYGIKWGRPQIAYTLHKPAGPGDLS